MHLYVGRSEEEYKEANESFRLNRVFPLLVSPLCITGLIGGQELGSPGQVLSKFGFLSNIVYTSPSTYPVDHLSLGEFTNSLYGSGQQGCRVEFRYRDVECREGVSDRELAFLSFLSL